MTKPVDTFITAIDEVRREADADIFLIWSNEHRAWWGPGRCGYSIGFQEAGRYSRAEAFDICRQALPSALHLGTIAEIPVRVGDLRAFMAGGMIPACVVTGCR